MSWKKGRNEMMTEPRPTLLVVDDAVTNIDMLLETLGKDYAISIATNDRINFSLKYMAISITNPTPRPPPARGGGVNVQTLDPLRKGIKEVKVPPPLAGGG
jgi:hypothetical protein